MKFGDIVINHWASEDNPRRKGIFIRKKTDTIELTDGKGKFWKTYNDKKSRLEIVGNVLKDGSELAS
jgi:hypothetical protein